MKWEENWTSGRKVEREGSGKEARKMERRKEEGQDKWKRGREGKRGMGMKGEENWRGGKKVEQEGRGEEARRMERGREEKRNGRD